VSEYQTIVRILPSLISISDEDLRVESILTYTKSNPFEIKLEVNTFEDTVISSIFSRELLLYGCATRTGIGSVCVESSEGITEVTLTTEERTVRVTFDTFDIVDFVNETTKIVRFGFEKIEIPNDISSLLN